MFDGHGIEGHDVSKFAIDNLSDCIKTKFDDSKVNSSEILRIIQDRQKNNLLKTAFLNLDGFMKY